MIYKLFLRSTFLVLFVFSVFVFSSQVLSQNNNRQFVGPTQAPPGGNVVIPNCLPDTVLTKTASGFDCTTAGSSIPTGQTTVPICVIEGEVPTIVDGIYTCVEGGGGLRISERAITETNLYLAGSGNNTLYTLNTSTGVAIRAGSLGNIQTVGLTTHKGQLYIISSDSLYKLNLETGVATQIGGDVEIPIGESGILIPTNSFSPLIGPTGLASDGEELFIVGGDDSQISTTKFLYKLNTSTGAAVRVGTANNGLGVNEFVLSGITFHDEKLYMLGIDEHIVTLYTIDTTTGVATRKPGSKQISRSELSNIKLASYNESLYMVGGSTNALYKLNTTTGDAIQVGEAIRFGVELTGPGGLTPHTATRRISCSEGEVVTFENGEYVCAPTPIPPIGLSKLGALSCSQGQYLRGVRGGALDCVSFPVCRDNQVLSRESRYNIVLDTNYSLFTCVTIPPEGSLYLIGDSAILYELNTETGKATRVGNTPSGFGVGENSPRGFAYHKGRLYIVGRTQKALYTLGPLTGRATRVGNATEFGINESVPQGLASDGEKLYFIGDSAILYELNTETGKATRVGNAPRGFSASETTPHGLGYHKGKLYLVGNSQRKLYELDTSTGAVIRQGRSNNFAVGETVPQGLASDGKKLYLVGGVNDILYELDTREGLATRVGNTPAGFGVNERQPKGIAFYYGTPTLGTITRTYETIYTSTDPLGFSDNVFKALNRSGDDPKGILLTSELTDGSLIRIRLESHNNFGVFTKIIAAEDLTSLEPITNLTNNLNLSQVGTTRNTLYTFRIPPLTKVRFKNARGFGIARDSNNNWYAVKQQNDEDFIVTIDRVVENISF